MRWIFGVIPALTLVVCLTSCGGPLQSDVMVDLSDRHGMMDTHVISKSMLDAALNVVDEAADPSADFASDPETEAIMNLVQNLEKVMVFNQDELSKKEENALDTEIRKGLEAQGSELLIETRIFGGEVALFVEEVNGVASRTQILLRSPYNADGTRQWPNLAPEESQEEPPVKKDDGSSIADLINIEGGLTLIECVGEIDIAKLSQMALSFSNQNLPF